MSDESARGRVMRVLTEPGQAIEDEVKRHNALMDALQATGRDVRALVNRLRASIEMYTDEGIIGNSGDFSLTLSKYETANNLLVHTIIWKVPATATLPTLQLGSQRVMQLPAVSGQWQEMGGPQLKSDDVRKLSWATTASAGGGDAYLWILGRQLPEVNF